MVEAAQPGSAGLKPVPIPGQHTMDYYTAPPNVLDTRIEDLLGNRFIMKRGQTEREREETTLTDTATCD